MRLTVARLRRVVKADLPIEFVPQQLTSYGGLELLRRYFRLLGLHRRIRQAFSGYGLGGDYGAGRLVLLVIALFVVGARRLEHLRYLAHDPLVARLAGLARIPTDRTVVNWLKQFTQEALQALITLNSELLYEQLERLDLPRLTIDVDGTVVRTGNTVAWAFRGYNPHFKKDPSYYPLLAHLAQTGHILRLKNRPGNVHDSRGAARFLRELIHELRDRFGRSLPLEFRMDAAFFQEEILALLAREGCEYAIKVGFWKWVGLEAAGRRAAPLDPDQRPGQRLRDRAAAGALGPDPPRGRLPQAGRARDPEELPARSLLPGRRALRVLGGHDEQGARPGGALGLHRGPRRPGEDLRGTQGRVRLRRGADPPLRGEQRLATPECPRPQSPAQLPAPDPRHAPSPARGSGPTPSPSAACARCASC